MTQPAPRVDRLAARLRERGHEAIALPLRQLVRCADAPEPAALVDALNGRYDWVIFVSPGAIALGLGGAHGPARRWPDSVGIAVVGPGSRQALAEAGLASPRIRIVAPERAPYDADALLASAPFSVPSGLAVLVVHGEQGRSDWLDELRARGARVDRLVLYRSEPVPPATATVELLRGWATGGAPATFVFTSVDGVRDCARLLATQSLARWACGQRALAVHPRIAAALSELGWQAVRLIEPGEPALLAGIESP
nr:uroporphyrinogen-III synthase [Quisquiliibacterium transsilvanicum]